MNTVLNLPILEREIRTEEQTVLVALDFIPNLCKMGKHGEKEVEKIFCNRHKQRRPQMIERCKLLRPILVRPGKYWPLLDEARWLFLEGYFYSCVAMCWITAERIAKDLLRNSIVLAKGNERAPPSEEQAFVLDRIEMNDIRELLIKSGVIDQELRKPFQELAELRNRYTHAGGQSPYEDAKEAIEYLHSIVEETVSVFRHYEIQQGKLVPKDQNGAFWR